MYRGRPCRGLRQSAQRRTAGRIVGCGGSQPAVLRRSAGILIGAESSKPDTACGQLAGPAGSADYAEGQQRGQPRCTNRAIRCQSRWLAYTSASGAGMPRRTSRDTRQSCTSRSSLLTASWRWQPVPRSGRWLMLGWTVKPSFSSTGPHRTFRPRNHRSRGAGLRRTIGRAEDGFGRQRRRPRPVIRRGRAEAVVGEEPLGSQPVVLPYCAHYVTAGHPVPRHMCHRVLPGPLLSAGCAGQPAPATGQPGRRVAASHRLISYRSRASAWLRSGGLEQAEPDFAAGGEEGDGVPEAADRDLPGDGDGSRVDQLFHSQRLCGRAGQKRRESGPPGRRSARLTQIRELPKRLTGWPGNKHHGPF